MSAGIVRSFAFLDLCGFTQYMDARGAAAAAARLAEMRATVRRCSGQHSVRVAKWLGDGSMLVAVDSAALVDCVAEIWREVPPGTSLPLRGGMASGEVLIFEGDDYIGHAVNIAARLCAEAAPGQLLATVECDPGHRLPVTSMRLRGVAVPLRVLSIESADARLDVLQAERPGGSIS